MTSVDRELAAALICLAPLGERGRAYVNTSRREFDCDAMLAAEPWSTGEAHLIRAAGALWRGHGVPLDLAYLATLDGEFFLAWVNAVAAYRGHDFRTDWAAALQPIAPTVACLIR